MGKSWKGFMAQNELVKLQWAAMEDSQVSLASKGFGALFGGKEPEQNSGQKEESAFFIPNEGKAIKAK